MKLIIKVFDRLVDVMAFLGGALCILTMLGVSADVVGRYFLSRPIVGMLEANQIAIVWLTFLGSAWLLRQGGHIKMDILEMRLRGRAQAWLKIIVSTVCAAMSLFLFWYGTLATVAAFQHGDMQATNVPINVGYVLLAIPLGSLPLFIQFLREVSSYWGGLKKLNTERAGGK